MDVCQPIVWNYTVKNTGTGVVRNTVLRDTLPDGLQTADGRSTVAADLGDIPAGASRTATARLRAARSGEFASAATVHSDAGDAKSEMVNTRARQPRLEVAVKGPDKEYLGKVVKYQVTVTNTGDTAAQRAAIHINSSEEAKVLNVSDSSGAAHRRGRSDNRQRTRNDRGGQECDGQCCSEANPGRHAES